MSDRHGEFDARGRRASPGEAPKWVQYRVAWAVSGGSRQRFFEALDDALAFARRQRTSGTGVSIFRQRVQEERCYHQPATEPP